MIDINEVVEIPEGTDVEMNENIIKVNQGEKHLERRFAYPGISIIKKDNAIVLDAKKASKREKRMIGTFKAHIKNMIKGVNESFEYKLKICSSHFPMNVSVEDNTLMIKNFLGEKIPRKAKILDDVNVKVEGSDIIVNGKDREKAGQTAANIEQACRIINRDRRIFNDGCWVVSKAGKAIK